MNTVEITSPTYTHIEGGTPGYCNHRMKRTASAAGPDAVVVLECVKCGYKYGQRWQGATTPKRESDAGHVVMLDANHYRVRLSTGWPPDAL